MDIAAITGTAVLRPYDDRMIQALHTLIYAEDPDAARAFFRDVLRFPAADTGGGWLIFKTGPSELGVHPAAWARGGTDQHFDLSLVCDDLPRHHGRALARGAEFAGEIEEQSWGTTARLEGARRRRDDALPAEVRPSGHVPLTAVAPRAAREHFTVRVAFRHRLT